MQNIVRNKFIRALCLLAVGVLLVMYSEQAPAWLVQGLGLLLVVPGAISLLSLLRKDVSRRETVLYPVMGLVTVVFGILLIAMPAFFVHAAMYVLAALLILAGCSQVHSRWRMCRMGIGINKATYLIPLLAVAAGIFVLAYKELAAALPFIILGAAYIMYALMELWSAAEIWKYNKQQAVAARLEKAGEYVPDDEVEYIPAEDVTDDEA